MNKEDVKASVKEYILKEFLAGENPENLTESTELITAGILDSLATLKLVAFLEETYGIKVEPHELVADHLNSVAEIADFVESKSA
jgi:acyl carrier protein